MPQSVSTFVATSLVALALGLSACSSTTPATPSSSSADSQALLPQDVGSTTSSAPDPDLASKLLTGEVAGFSLEQLGANVKGLLTELETLYHYSEEYQLDPAECDATGIEQLVVGSQASTGHEIATVALGTGTSSPQQHQQYAKKCARVDGTVNGEPILLDVQIQQIPVIKGATDVVATVTNHGIPYSEGDAGHNSYLITGNVGGVNVVAYTTTTYEGNAAGKEASMETTMKLFKAQVAKLKG